MTSRRQVVSNRRNARCSTGPKTIEGKQAVSNNARRHGLTGKLVEGSEAFQQAEELAHALLGNGIRGLEIEAAARDYAHAQVKLDQIRQYRRTFVETMLQPSLCTLRSEADCHDAADHDSSDLAKLARYERMARAERRRALGQLEGLIKQFDVDANRKRITP